LAGPNAFPIAAEITNMVCGNATFLKFGKGVSEEILEAIVKSDRSTALTLGQNQPSV
jgi:hypothetical protein